MLHQRRCEDKLRNRTRITLNRRMEVTVDDISLAEIVPNLLREQEDRIVKVDRMSSFLL